MSTARATQLPNGVPGRAGVPRSLVEALAPRQRKWTAVEAELLGDSGFFGDERVELLWGELYSMTPISAEHAAALQRTLRVLWSMFADEFTVRVQAPLQAGENSRPEPDLAVVPTASDDYASAHPSTAVLVVEVSVSSLEFDLNEKSAIYAGMGIPEVWVLNVIDRRLEVLREPAPNSGHPRGHSYKFQQSFGEQDSVGTLVKPAISVLVADLLPPCSRPS